MDKEELKRKKEEAKEKVEAAKEAKDQKKEEGMSHLLIFFSTTSANSNFVA